MVNNYEIQNDKPKYSSLHHNNIIIKQIKGHNGINIYRHYQLS